MLKTTQTKIQKKKRSGRRLIIAKRKTNKLFSGVVLHSFLPPFPSRPLNDDFFKCPECAQGWIWLEPLTEQPGHLPVQREIRISRLVELRQRPEGRLHQRLPGGATYHSTVDQVQTGRQTNARLALKWKKKDCNNNRPSFKSETRFNSPKNKNTPATQLYRDILHE